MKKITLLFSLLFMCLSYSQDLTMTLTGVDASATSVRLTGPFWGWDPNAGPVASENTDGSWTVTLAAPSENMEYLWIVDGVQENLIDNAVAAECSSRIQNVNMVTDYANYANRLWKTTDTLDLVETYDSCTPFSAPTAQDLTMTLTGVDASATSVRLTGPFWGWDPNAGPVASENTDGSWTVTLAAPSENMEYLWIVDGVQENLIDNAVAAECSSRIQNVNMVTDYANYANRLWKTTDTLDLVETYDSCTPFSESLSTQPFELSSAVKMFPNPAKNTVQFSVNSNQNLDIEIFDMLGKSVLRVNDVQNEVNISDLNSGLYFVQMTLGTQQATKKLIIN